MSTTTSDGFTVPGMAWLSDMSLTPRRVQGALRVGYRLSRRLRTPRGRCLRHPNDGTDVSDLIGSTLTGPEASSMESRIKAECEKDVSVTTAKVSITLSADGHVATISVQASGAFGSVSVVFTSLSDGTLAVEIT